MAANGCCSTSASASARHEDWLELGRSLTARGLTEPLLVVADGAPGLMRAIAELWHGADRHRCSVHRLRNVLAKLPKDVRCTTASGPPTGSRSTRPTRRPPAEADLRALVGQLERQHPSVAACLADDLPALTVHPRYPLSLRKRLRSTNLLERRWATSDAGPR